MKKKHSIKKSTILKFAVASATAIGVQAASAQDLYFVEHKPSGLKMQSCAEEDGGVVKSAPSSASWYCVQWERVPAGGEYFHLRNEYADRYLAPGSEWSGAWIKMQPKTWTGDWTQWTFSDAGDGYGYIIHKYTDKQIFLSGSAGDNVEMQPRTWTGDYTRWKFTPVDGGGSTPTPTPTPATPTPTPTPTDEPVPSSVAPGLATSAQLGTYLVADNNHAQAGFTLYTFDDDEGGPDSTCYDDCAVAWPPYTVAPGTSLVSPSGDAVLGTSARRDGALQVTLNGEPLYFFVRDGAAGDTTGHEAGGVWWVADVIPPSTPTPTPTPDSETPTPTPAPDLDAGHDVIDGSTALYWHKNMPGWPTSGDYYMCKNLEQDCYRAELNNGRWEVTQNNMAAGTYTAQLKVPGMGADLFPKWEVVWAGGGSGGPGDGGNPGNPGSVPSDKNPEIVAPSIHTEILPALDYGHTADAGNFLVGGIGNGDELFGFTLFTFAPDEAYGGTSNCVDCAAWPALVVESEEAIIRPSRLIGDLGTITLPSGELQVTYNGKPLYFRSADTVPGQTDGANGSWPLATVETETYQEVMYQNALKTPANMGVAVNGFGFNITGNAVTWQFGSGLAGTVRDTVTFFCSADQLDFHAADLSSGRVNIPSACANADTYWYFFRYELNNPGAGVFEMNDDHDFDPASAYRYTALYINDGTTIDLSAQPEFVDIGANWMRFRHPRAYDGVTEAIRDATHNSSRVAELARYSITATETYLANGNVSLYLDFELPLGKGQSTEKGLVRVEGLQNGAGDAKLPTWTFNPIGTPNRDSTAYAVNGEWSYGQSMSYEMTGVVGHVDAQTYNTFQYYTFGLGFHVPIGDPRLALVPKGGTHMVYNIKNYGMEFKNGHTGAGISDVIMDKMAIFTQHLTTIEQPAEVDDFLWGHHLFHGVKLIGPMLEEPNQENLGSNPGDTGFGREIPEIKEGGPIACGDCHFRDGRGSHVIETAAGPRIAPPTFGVGLLQYIDGREAGFTWNGSVPTVRQQIKNALVADHGLDISNEDEITKEQIELISRYTEFLTMPVRHPGTYDEPGVAEGEVLFSEIGCADCHTPLQRTSAQAPRKFRNMVIRPYTDMKVHSVADGNYRTAPLWGLGRNIQLLEGNNRVVNNDLSMPIALKGTHEEQMKEHHLIERPLLFLHDGRATTLEGAITGHKNSSGASDADAAVNAFEGLSAADKANIVKFLRSL